MKNWIIAIAVAAVYLLVSLLTGLWKLTWLIWIGYAAYRLATPDRAEDARGKS